MSLALALLPLTIRSLVLIAALTTRLIAALPGCAASRALVIAVLISVVLGHMYPPLSWTEQSEYRGVRERRKIRGGRNLPNLPGFELVRFPRHCG